MKNEFDNILDRCLERMLVGGETPEDCLRDYPEHAAELKPLLYCALSGKKALDIQPRPEFRARAKAQFLAAVREAGERKQRSFFGWRPAWATVTAVVLVFVVASSATIVAADNSMPDEPLYTVKTITETARLTLTTSPVKKAALNAELADKRVAEIVHLANKGKLDEIEKVTERLNRNLETITELTGSKQKQATVALAPTPKPASKPEAVAAPAAKPAPATLAAPAAPVPPPATATPAPKVALKPATPTPSPAQDSAKAGARIAPAPAKTAPPTSLKPTPTVTPKKNGEKAKLKETVKKAAQNNPQQLRDAIKKAPESVKPALRRALAASEKGYKQASDALEEDDD